MPLTSTTGRLAGKRRLSLFPANGQGDGRADHGGGHDRSGDCDPDPSGDAQVRNKKAKAFRTRGTGEITVTYYLVCSRRERGRPFISVDRRPLPGCIHQGKNPNRFQFDFVDQVIFLMLYQLLGAGNLPQLPALWMLGQAGRRVAQKLIETGGRLQVIGHNVVPPLPK